MATSKIDKSNWQAYCDQLSKTLTGTSAEIEIDSLAIGQQLEAKWLPFLGIVYEPKTNTIEILVEGLDHIIHDPQELYVDYDAVGLTSLEVISEDDVRQIVKLRQPVMLPPPAAGTGIGPRA
ncbi:MAG: hypothetical protein A3I66_04780 [Burkholderiales bacterium RIFCSPLOWO2_02_FULL_57_36]|nr:MAG: hypothetical protein A3I66_04780 [Burkholderiales bacterium RIFCSPLOWO2_02_FULL_57_36]